MREREGKNLTGVMRMSFNVAIWLKRETLSALSGGLALRRAAPALMALMFCLAPTSYARADIAIQIDKSDQTMQVSVDGLPRYQWKISSGRRGYHTPIGTFRPTMLARHWYSRKYDNSPMPYSIFFHHGFAIHGTNYVSRLGRPASHGCIRLHPSQAATLFSLVREHGPRNTRIIITH